MARTESLDLRVKWSVAEKVSLAPFEVVFLTLRKTSFKRFKSIPLLILLLYKSLICEFFECKVRKNGQQKRATCFLTLLQIVFKSNVARLPATNQTCLATNQLLVAGFEKC